MLGSQSAVRTVVEELEVGHERIFCFFYLHTVCITQFVYIRILQVVHAIQ